MPMLEKYAVANEGRAALHRTIIVRVDSASPEKETGGLSGERKVPRRMELHEGHGNPCHAELTSLAAADVRQRLSQRYVLCRTNG